MLSGLAQERNKRPTIKEVDEEKEYDGSDNEEEGDAAAETEDFKKRVSDDDDI